jgi:hypothetical protein
MFAEEKEDAMDQLMRYLNDVDNAKTRRVKENLVELQDYLEFGAERYGPAVQALQLGDLSKVREYVKQHGKPCLLKLLEQPEARLQGEAWTELFAVALDCDLVSECLSHPPKQNVLSQPLYDRIVRLSVQGQSFVNVFRLQSSNKAIRFPFAVAWYCATEANNAQAVQHILQTMFFEHKRKSANFHVDVWTGIWSESVLWSVEQRRENLLADLIRHAPEPAPAAARAAYAKAHRVLSDDPCSSMSRLLEDALLVKNATCENLTKAVQTRNFKRLDMLLRAVTNDKIVPPTYHESFRRRVLVSQDPPSEAVRWLEQLPTMDRTDSDWSSILQVVWKRMPESILPLMQHAPARNSITDRWMQKAIDHLVRSDGVPYHQLNLLRNIADVCQLALPARHALRFARERVPFNPPPGEDWRQIIVHLLHLDPDSVGDVIQWGMLTRNDDLIRRISRDSEPWKDRSYDGLVDTTIMIRPTQQRKKNEAWDTEEVHRLLDAVARDLRMNPGTTHYLAGKTLNSIESLSMYLHRGESRRRRFP